MPPPLVFSFLVEITLAMTVDVATEWELLDIISEVGDDACDWIQDFMSFG